MTESIYSEDDSAEVRKTWWGALGDGRDERPMIVTEAEYERFAGAGCDMEKFVTMKTLRRLRLDAERYTRVRKPK